MKINGKRILTAGVTLAISTGVAVTGAGSASATNMVDCGYRTDFVKIYRAGLGSVCLANAGTYPGLNYVQKVEAGNNVVSISYVNNDGSGRETGRTLDRWTGTGWLPTTVKLTSIRIH